MESGYTLTVIASEHAFLLLSVSNSTFFAKSELWEMEMACSKKRLLLFFNFQHYHSLLAEPEPFISRLGYAPA